MIQALLLILIMSLTFPASALTHKECVEILTTETKFCREHIRGDDQDIQFAICMYKQLQLKDSKSCDQFYKEQCSEAGNFKIKCKTTKEMLEKAPAPAKPKAIR